MRSDCEDQTRQLAAQFAKNLEANSVVGLIGPLGAGKTCFVQGMALGIGVPPESYITSPTFTLVQEYLAGRLPLYHFDLYRLNSYRELADIGFEETIQNNGISVIEWADRFPELRNLLTHQVTFTIIGEEERAVEIAGPLP